MFVVMEKEKYICPQFFCFFLSGISVAFVFGSLLTIPIFHFIQYSLTKLRDRVWRKIFEDSNESLKQKVELNLVWKSQIFFRYYFQENVCDSIYLFEYCLMCFLNFHKNEMQNNSINKKYVELFLI